MDKITLNSDLRNQLPDLSRPFEICDETGLTIGRFTPEVMICEATGQPIGRIPAAPPPVSREEIERRKQNKGKTYSTEEVLAYLEKL